MLLGDLIGVLLDKDTFTSFVNENIKKINLQLIKELIKDIFYTNAELKENTIINLDNICDVFYKLSYRGKFDNELLFSLC